MFKKIAPGIFTLFAIAILYLKYQYYHVQDIKLIADAKINYLQNAADNFSNYGYIICIAVWVAGNIAVVKTKNTWWLWVPLVFVAVVASLASYHAEEIFIFKKENDLHNGSFSLNYLQAVFVICIAIVILVINYFILNYVLHKKNNLVLL